MKTEFTQSWRMPLLTLLLVIPLMMIVVRVRIFLKQSYGSWRSTSGLSVMLGIFAGLVSITYFMLQAALFTKDQLIFNLFNQMELNTANMVAEDASPETLNDKQIKWMLSMLNPMLDMVAVSRFLITIVLWSVKFSILAVYLEKQVKVSKFAGFIIQSAVPFFCLTFMACITLQWQGQVTENPRPTAEDLRNGAYVTGITFTQMNDFTETAIALMNVATDCQLIYIAYKTITSLGYPVSSGSLLYIMSGSTFLIAIARLGLTIRVMACDQQCIDKLDVNSVILTPNMVLLEFEMYVAIMISCLPGLRAFLRNYHGQNLSSTDQENTLVTPTSCETMAYIKENNRGHKTGRYY